MNVEKLQELAQDLPEGIKENALDLLSRMGDAIEGIGDEPITWRPPHLRLVQGTTDRSKLAKGVGIGDLVIGETKVDAPLNVIPLRQYDARQYWNPDQNETNLLCSSPDGKKGYLGYDCRECPHGKFNEETRKSECSKLKVVIAITRDLSDIVIINFAKTNYAVGMEWQSLMKKAGVSPYKRVYAVSSQTSTKYKNIENFVVSPLSDKERATDPAVIPFIEELFKTVTNDRNEQVVQFYKFLEERAEKGATMLGNDTADSNVTLITSEAGAEGEPASSPDDTMTTNYQF